MGAEKEPDEKRGLLAGNDFVHLTGFYMYLQSNVELSTFHDIL